MKTTIALPLVLRRHGVLSTLRVGTVSASAALLCALLCTSCTHNDAPGGASPADHQANVSRPRRTRSPEIISEPLKRACALLFEGKRAEADALFKEQIAVHPNTADVYCYTATRYAQDNKPDLAIADYTRAIKLNPSSERAYGARGDQYYKQQQYDLALADCNAAIQLAPDHAVHWCARAGVYLEKGQYFKAMTDATEAIGLYRGYAQAYYARAQGWRGLKTLDQALADINSAVRLLPNDVNYLALRSLIYYDLCLLDLCKADCGKIIALDSKNPGAYFWRGRCDLLLTNYDQARADLLNAKRLAPSGKTDVAEWLERIDDLQYDFAHKPSTLAQQWAIACAAQLSQRNRQGIYSLTGERPNQKNRADHLVHLRKDWQINSHDDLLKVLRWLETSGFNQDWLAYTKMTNREGLGEEIGSLVGAISNKTDMEHRLKVVHEYGASLGDRGILAWDLCHYIALCRWGCLVGLLGEKEAYQLIMPAAARLQKTYGSWNQMGDEYLIGRKFCTVGDGKEDEESYNEVDLFLFTCKSSPWVYLPWATKLE